MWRDDATLLDIAQAAEFKTAHPEIEWVKIAGMRNRLIHGYEKIRWDVVWRTATEAIPKLLAQLDPLLPGEEA